MIFLFALIRNITIIVVGPVAVFMAYIDWTRKYTYLLFPMTGLGASFSIAALGIYLAFKKESENHTIKQRLLLVAKIVFIFLLPSVIMDSYNYFIMNTAVNEEHGMRNYLVVNCIAIATGVLGIQRVMKKDEREGKNLASVVYIVCASGYYFLMLCILALSRIDRVS